MAVVVTGRDGRTFRFEDAFRWGYDDGGNLEVEGKDGTIRASFSFYTWESVRLEDDE